MGACPRTSPRPRRPGAARADLLRRERRGPAARRGAGGRPGGRRLQAGQDLQSLVALLPGQAGQHRVAEDPRQHGLAEGDRIGTVLPARAAPGPRAQHLPGGAAGEVREHRLVERLRGRAGRAGHDRGQPAHIRPGRGGGAGRFVGSDGPRPQLVRRGRVAAHGLLVVERLPIPGEVLARGLAGHRVDGQQDIDHPGLHRLGFSRHVFLPGPARTAPWTLPATRRAAVTGTWSLAWIRAVKVPVVRDRHEPGPGVTARLHQEPADQPVRPLSPATRSSPESTAVDRA